jgi:hypothetical protein
VLFSLSLPFCFMQFAVAQITASVQHLRDRTFFIAWVFGNRISTPLFTKGVRNGKQDGEYRTSTK